MTEQTVTSNHPAKVTAWRPFWNRWADERRVIAWVFPLGGGVIAWATLVNAVALFAIWTEDFGEKQDKKIVLVATFLGILLLLIYLCIGVFQLFFLELRQKFIAREVVWDGRAYQLKGYYFKQASFNPVDIAAVEEYRVGHRYLSSTIMTLLNRTPAVNWRVRLKDGRTFYLPADISGVAQLKDQLCEDAAACS